MPIDTTVPGSPGWWLKRLGTELGERNHRIVPLVERYEGDGPLPEGAQGCREAYQRFQRKARTNYAELIVDATGERIIPGGFRTGAEDDENGDKLARRICKANDYDVFASDVHRDMLTTGYGYAIVGPPDEDGYPVITREDPQQTITAHDPRRPQKVLAGLKVFTDDMRGQDLAYLYLPMGNRCWSLVARRESSGLPLTFDVDPAGWEWDRSLSGQLPFADVPVVRFRNRNGVGEFEPHTDLIDRISHMILQRLVIATVQAFKQRGLKGVPSTDAEGNDIDYTGVFTADPGALWLLPEGADIWESGQVDLTPILSAVKDDIRDLAAVTRTPMHYLTPDGANQSAEGASLAREGLVFKAKDRIKRVTSPHERVMSLAFKYLNDPQRAALPDLEAIFLPPEQFSLSERADAASKAQDVPWRTRMADIWQFGPEQVDRMESERAADAIIAGLAQPPAVTDVNPA